MSDRKKRREISRREFLGKSAVGVTALSLSPALMELLLTSAGCKTGAKATGGLIIPEDALKKAVGFLMAKGADFGDIYMEKAILGSIQSDDRKISTSSLIEKGVGVRAVKDG